MSSRKSSIWQENSKRPGVRLSKKKVTKAQGREASTYTAGIFRKILNRSCVNLAEAPFWKLLKNYAAGLRTENLVVYCARLTESLKRRNLMRSWKARCWSNQNIFARLCRST